MTTAQARPHDRRDGHLDRGSSVLLVLVTMTIIAALVTVGLNRALNTLQYSDTSDDWREALAAAESGVDDYVARLNRDDNYWRTADCNNVAIKGNPAVTGTVSSCGWGASTPLGWKTVLGSSNAAFHYDIDIRDTFVDGTIKLTSTGRVGKRTRSIQVVLRRLGFGEFLYYTVYETTDPANETVYGLDNSTAQNNCARYYWGSTTRRVSTQTTNMSNLSYYCRDINFVTGDRINGPMHSNDAILISGSPQFRGTTTTSYPSCRGATSSSQCYRPNGSTSPTFSRGISYRGEIQLPTSIGDMRQYVTYGAGVPAANVGCLYTGPTRIVFQTTTGTATPMMRVWSKWSGLTGGGVTWSNYSAQCGTTTALQSSAGALIPVPQNKVVMVQNVPQAQTQPNTTSACTTNGIGDSLPVANDFNSTFRSAQCRYGTLYVEGQLKGRLTMTADNDIIVTGDITYNGGENGTDALGLIAENSVNIYHPVQRTSSVDNNGNVVYTYTNLNRNGNRAPLTNVTLSAAVLTLKHSFGVQMYDQGAKLNNLTVFGSLAQRFRGAVGTGSSTSGTGYIKDYNYDSRLRYSPPPYFLDPVESAWGWKTFGEATPKY